MLSLLQQVSVSVGTVSSSRGADMADGLQGQMGTGMDVWSDSETNVKILFTLGGLLLFSSLLAACSWIRQVAGGRLGKMGIIGDDHIWQHKIIPVDGQSPVSEKGKGITPCFSFCSVSALDALLLFSYFIHTRGIMSVLYG